PIVARKTPITRPGTDQTAQSGPRSDIADFVAQVGAMSAERRVGEGTRRGRLLFALDATMSRQPTWDLACRLQGEMFETVAKTGGLDVQLIYFRGFGECRASRWASD